MNVKEYRGVQGHSTVDRVFVLSGEFRRPKTGEFYMSGDYKQFPRRRTRCVFVANRTLDASYRIMTEIFPGS